MESIYLCILGSFQVMTHTVILVRKLRRVRRKEDVEQDLFRTQGRSVSEWRLRAVCELGCVFVVVNLWK